MAEHRVDGLTVTLRGYSGLPLPEDLTEAVELRVAVGTQLDLEQLADEVREDLAGRVFVIEQRYRETRWGASGDVMQLVVDVEPVGDGYRVNLETPLGPFVVEIDSHRVSHMRRN